jgi:hypothetical protein
MHARYILALSFVPIDRLTEYIQRLKDYFEREKSCEYTHKLFNWFILKFCDLETKGNHNPIHLSVFSRVLNGLPRTQTVLRPIIGI